LTILRILHIADDLADQIGETNQANKESSTMSAQFRIAMTIVFASLAGSANAQFRTPTPANAAQHKRSSIDADKQVQGRLVWLEQQIAREQKVLVQQLRRAEAIRATALKSFNIKQLDEAEAIEQRAFSTYARRIATLEKTAAPNNAARVPAQRLAPAVKPKASSSPAASDGPWKMFKFGF
jgi:hypothetical protein